MRANIRCWALVATIMALGGCGGGSAPSTPRAPNTDSSAAFPTPPPSPPVGVDGTGNYLDCTSVDAVIDADLLTIRPVARRVRVVAFGSSSTEGAYASSPAASYPAVLSRMLRGLPIAYTVDNKGRSRDFLRDLEQRLVTDVMSTDPQLVILQTGTNDASAGPNLAEMDSFKRRLRDVIRTIKTKSAVVLMTSQIFPTQSQSYLDYQDAMRVVAKEEGIAVFDRHEMMQSWIKSKRYDYSDVLAADKFHPNDYTYYCMARVLYDLIKDRTIAR